MCVPADVVRVDDDVVVGEAGRSRGDEDVNAVAQPDVLVALGAHDTQGRHLGLIAPDGEVQVLVVVGYPRERAGGDGALFRQDVGDEGLQGADAFPDRVAELAVNSRGPVGLIDAGDLRGSDGELGAQLLVLALLGARDDIGHVEAERLAAGELLLGRANGLGQARGDVPVLPPAHLLAVEPDVAVAGLEGVVDIVLEPLRALLGGHPGANVLAGAQTEEVIHVQGVGALDLLAVLVAILRRNQRQHLLTDRLVCVRVLRGLGVVVGALVAVGDDGSWVGGVEHPVHEGGQ